jgi:SAM-dependent methyltransferase
MSSTVKTYFSGKATAEQADFYHANTKEISTRYLGRRDLDLFLKDGLGLRALDFGCGTGLSTAILLAKGYTVEAVDISAKMMETARASHPNVNFHLLPSTTSPLPFPDRSFDVVFSSLVLFELSSREMLHGYLAEAARVLKDGGQFVAVTGSVHLHDPTYQSNYLQARYEENEARASGREVRVEVTEIRLVFVDYFWTEEDYQTECKAVGMPIVDVHYPLGKEGEGREWKDELVRSPMLLIHARKTVGQ